MLDRLDDYLALMAVRMGPRLQYALELPADLREQPIPPLLLQPLVENAIKHGLEPKIEGGMVSVTASASGNLLQLEILDDGVGSEPDKTLSNAGGFGLAQVRERLATTYGAAADIETVASRAGGMRVSIRLPLK